jgi:hypothetical protein
VCDHDVALVAQVDDLRATVGRIHAQAPIDVLERRAHFARVRVRSRTVFPISEASLFVRDADLQSCREQAASPRTL